MSDSSRDNQRNVNEDPITSLKVVRDIFFEYKQFVDRLIQVADKYKVGINNTGGFDITKTEDVEKLTKVLPKDKTGEFLLVLSSIFSIQSDFTNMVSFDRNQLEQFTRRLNQTISKFDKLLEGL